MRRVCARTTGVNLRAHDIGIALLLSSSGFGQSMPDSGSVASTSSTVIEPISVQETAECPKPEVLHRYYTALMGIPDGPHLKWFCNYVTAMKQYPNKNDGAYLRLLPRARKVTSSHHPQVNLNGHKIYVQTGLGPSFLDVDEEEDVDFLVVCVSQLKRAVQMRMRNNAASIIETAIDEMRMRAEQALETYGLPNIETVLEQVRALSSDIKNDFKQTYTRKCLEDRKFFKIDSLPRWSSANYRLLGGILARCPTISSPESRQRIYDYVEIASTAGLRRAIEQFPDLNAWLVLEQSILAWRLRSMRRLNEMVGTRFHG